MQESKMEQKLNVDNVEQENEFCKKIARILNQSFRLSQGDPDLQKAILMYVGKSLTMSKKFKYGELDEKIIGYLGGILAGNKKLEEGLHPAKEVALGSHSEVTFKESDMQLSLYLRALRGNFTPSESNDLKIDGKRQWEAIILKGMLTADVKYVGGFKWFSNATRRDEWGRPGRLRTENVEDYDNYRKDKFFSYFVVFLLKNKDYPEDVDGIFTKMFNDLKASTFFKDLVENNNLDISIRTGFRSLVGRYNIMHKVGKVMVPGVPLE